MRGYKRLQEVTRGYRRLHIYLFSWIFVLNGLSYASEEQYIAESFGLCSKGVRYYEKGNLYEAKGILEKAIKLDPRNEEAQAYLELVNAELKMRAEGILDSYQKPDELVRESDRNVTTTYNK